MMRVDDGKFPENSVLSVQLVCKLFVLDKNTWDHRILRKLFVLDRNTLYHNWLQKIDYHKIEISK